MVSKCQASPETNPAIWRSQKGLGPGPSVCELAEGALQVAGIGLLNLERTCLGRFGISKGAPCFGLPPYKNLTCHTWEGQKLENLRKLRGSNPQTTNHQTTPPFSGQPEALAWKQA